MSVQPWQFCRDKFALSLQDSRALWSVELPNRVLSSVLQQKIAIL